MIKKAVLTIPAVLSGPALILAISLTIYDFTVTGGSLTALVISFAAVRSVWSEGTRGS
jgi:hypothetical protein